MKKLQEALEPDDQIRILDLERNIIDLKQQLVQADGQDQKDRINGEIEDLQRRIQDIRDSAE